VCIYNILTHWLFHCTIFCKPKELQNTSNAGTRLNPHFFFYSVNVIISHWIVQERIWLFLRTDCRFAVFPSLPRVYLQRSTKLGVILRPLQCRAVPCLTKKTRQWQHNVFSTITYRTDRSSCYIIRPVSSSPTSLVMKDAAQLLSNPDATSRSQRFSEFQHTTRGH
jgi:hypothetical protein